MRATVLILSAALAVAPLGAGASAQESDDPAATPIPREAPNQSTPQLLSCIANGQAYSPGEIACVPACHGRQRLARCDAVAQSADWTTISDACPSARLTPLPPGNPAYPTVLACTLMTDAPFAQVQ